MLLFSKLLMVILSAHIYIYTYGYVCTDSDTMSVFHAGRLMAWCHWKSELRTRSTTGWLPLQRLTFQMSNKTGWSLGHPSPKWKARTWTSTKKQWVRKNQQTWKLIYDMYIYIYVFIHYILKNGKGCCEQGISSFGKDLYEEFHAHDSSFWMYAIHTHNYSDLWTSWGMLHLLEDSSIIF